jgi:hypothetical protein
MDGQLLPPPDLAPPTTEDLSPAQRIEVWIDLMNACDQFLMAGLQRSAGPQSNLQDAYRHWYAGQMEEHDRTMNHLVEEFNRRWAARVR